MQGKHMLLRGGSGTGKTLAYLLPILNNLYNVQSEDPLGSVHSGLQKSIKKENEDQMFQNAN